MAELGKIERPQVGDFKSGRKLYVVPTLPFEELAPELRIGAAQIERFWGEVREKIDYFISTYGNVSTVFVEGAGTGDVGLAFFEKFGKRQQSLQTYLYPHRKRCVVLNVLTLYSSSSFLNSVIFILAQPPCD